MDLRSGGVDDGAGLIAGDVGRQVLARGVQGLSSWLGPPQCGARRQVMELDVCLAVNGGHDEVPAGKQIGMALAIVLDPTSSIAQREPATLAELDLEDRSTLYQPTVEEVPQAGSVAVELEGGATEIK